MSTSTIIKYQYNLLANNASLQLALKGTAIDKKIYPVLPNRFERFPCIVYSVIDSSTNAVPANTESLIIQYDILAKESKSQLEEISDLLKSIIKYDTSETPRLYWTIKTNEVDDNETDRQLFKKYIRARLTYHL